jgi:hypothetical protein
MCSSSKVPTYKHEILHMIENFLLCATMLLGASLVAFKHFKHCSSFYHVCDRKLKAYISAIFLTKKCAILYLVARVNISC